MPHVPTTLAAGVLLAMIAGTATVDAKSKGSFGSCAVKGGRAPCDWVEWCLLEGGLPERQPFSGKLLCCFSKSYCEGMPQPVPDTVMTPPAQKNHSAIPRFGKR